MLEPRISALGCFVHARYSLMGNGEIGRLYGSHLLNKIKRIVENLICWRPTNYYRVGGMPHPVVNFLACWTGRFAKYLRGDSWKVAPLCLM